MIFFWFIQYLLVKTWTIMKMLPKRSFPGRIFHEIFGLDPEQQNTSSLTGRLPGRFCRHGLFWLLIVVFIAGCGGVSVVGIHPEYPPLEKKTFSIYTDFVEVDSLRPTFQWQPFPGPEDHLAGKVQNVTYELRVWTTIQGESGKLRYARNGLKLPYHKLEEPLEPSSKYLWSVRARFMIDDHFRVIEWGLAGFPLRNETVPNLSCFRFRTPAWNTKFVD
jgi:hypothetical protein